MFILPVHNLINTGQSLFVMSLLHSLSSNDCLRKKYARVETQLKNICFFVSLATIPALKMTHLLLAGLPR